LEVKTEIDKIDYAIIGIGINVNNEISSLVPEAISLKEILKKT
jgi:BirA family biotin operon repressor/biotin-[acetyl-CoA-carboxylase] ligase